MPKCWLQQTPIDEQLLGKTKYGYKRFINDVASILELYSGLILMLLLFLIALGMLIRHLVRQYNITQIKIQ
jgi:hypothetical protein